jgi:hypothetical protein
MSNLEDKDIENYAKLKAVGMIGSSENNKWYSWGTPIGLSIFFLSITAIVVIIKMFLLK